MPKSAEELSSLPITGLQQEHDELFEATRYWLLDNYLKNKELKQSRANGRISEGLAKRMTEINQKLLAFVSDHKCEDQEEPSETIKYKKLSVTVNNSYIVIKGEDLEEY